MSNAYSRKYVELCGGSRMLAWLIGLNMAISIVALCVMAASSVMSGIVTRILTLPSEWIAFLTHPWTLLTYMVTQFSVLHLLVNVLWLLWFGRLILNEVSDKQLGLCYLAGGIVGGIAYLVTASLGGSAGEYLCGSSAAVIGVMCMAGVLMGNRELRFMLLGNIKVKWVAIVCVVLTLVGTQGTTAVTMAHLGGAAGGILYALLLKFQSSPRGGAVAFNIDDLADKFRKQKPKRERERRPDTVAEAMRGRLNDHERLDELLDKIRVSGYNSLSDVERRELDALTKRL